MNTMLAVEAESVRKLRTDELYRCTLYILCDDNFKPVPGVVVTGISGDLKSESNRIPLVILKDGRGDCGSDYEDEHDRFFRTNLRSRTIRPGELFTVWWKNKLQQRNREIETSYRITKVTPLAGLLAA